MPPYPLYSLRSSVTTTPNAQAALLKQLRDDHCSPLDLTLSNPLEAALDYENEAIEKAFEKPGLMTYEPEAQGRLSSREAIASFYETRGVNMDASRIVMTASTSEAYAFIFKLLCNPGDNVLVARPSYPLFDFLARYESVELKPYDLAYDGVWHIDFDSLTRAIDSRTRAIIVVSPANPTGNFVKTTELKKLGELGLPIISDEVFSEFAVEPAAGAAATALGNEEVFTFALHGLSKLAGLPNMKVGWMTLSGPTHDVANALDRLTFISDAFLSANTWVQASVPALLASRSQYVDSVRQRLTLNYQRAKTLLAGTAATPLRVEGGWSLIIQMPRTHSDEDWAMGLLKSALVVTQPGFFYDTQQEAMLVVSLLTPPDIFSEGLRRIEDYLRRAR